MIYEGRVFRPPSESRSLILQLTIGCAHNGCTFCGMYKEKTFRVRPLEDVLAELDGIKDSYRGVRRIFLADGDALCLPQDYLKAVLTKLNTLFPSCGRVGIYATPRDVLGKTGEELIELRDLGLGILYIGGESGSDAILKAINKGSDRQALKESILKAEGVGLATSVTFISGIGGRDHAQEHAKETATLISESQPSYVGLLTLMLEPETSLYGDIQSGKFRRLTPEEILEETALLLKGIQVEKPCVFRSNHASNYLSLGGTLPEEKEDMMAQIRYAMGHREVLKAEAWRRL